MIFLLSRAGKDLVTRHRVGPLSKNSFKIGHQKTKFLKVMSFMGYFTILQLDYSWKTTNETEARKIF